jgi:uncharacterized membrane protein
MLVAFPALLFIAGWLLIGARAPGLPTLLTVGLLALAGQVFLLLGAGASGRLALLGAAGGYLFAVLVATLCVQWFHITGVYSPLLRDLWYAPDTAHLDFAHLALGTIALAGAGIIADLAVAVTATVQEVHKANPNLSGSQLFASGMRFGRDVIGTEINTLPFALLGSGIGGILLMLVKPDVAHWPFSWMTLVNQQNIAVEIAAMAAGTIGLALTIPLTALLVSRHLGYAARVGVRLPVAVPARKAFFRATPGWLLVVAALLTVLAFRFIGRTAYRYPRGTQTTQTSLVRGRVLSVETPGAQGGSSGQRLRNETLQTLHAHTTEENTLVVENSITGSPVNDRQAEPGDRVIIRVQEADGNVYASLSEFERDRGLLVLLLGVCAVVVLVSGWMGWRALAALAASLGIIGVFLFLLVRARAAPLPLTIGCACAVTAVTYVILCGFGRKAAGACLGVVLGLTVAATAGLLFGRWMGLSGRYDGDLMALAFYSSAQVFDFPALLGASVLIGALGVTMDVSIAVASAVTEVCRANPQSGFRTLLAAGMSVGRKVIVAMFGAIFFASFGLNIGLFLLPWVAPGSLGQTLGNERVATEVYRLLIGGLAIAWCVPSSALCSAWLAIRGGRKAAEEVAA